ncbi:MAG: hypothetical protein ACPLRY_04285 [Candidatus Bathyarchaeales archaeon]
MLKIYKVSLLIIVALTLVYAFQGYYPGFISFFSNAFPPLIAGATVIISGFSLGKYWHKAREQFSIVWLFFTCGLFLWFMGEAAWAGYTLILGVEVPYPSVADVFWVSGYIPFFIALLLYVKLFSSALSLKMFAASLLITVGLAIFVSAALITPILGVEEDLVTMAMDFAYPLLDITLFSVAFLGLLIFWKGNLGKSWLLINVAILLDVCADMLFSYATAQGTYYSGHVADLIFDLSYLFFLIAFYIHAKEF